MKKPHDLQGPNCYIPDTIYYIPYIVFSILCVDVFCAPGHAAVGLLAGAKDLAPLWAEDYNYNPQQNQVITRQELL